MDDVIRRQDAIDEIARWIGYLDKDMISRIQIGLERLPSAQPEIEERMSETEQNVPNDDFISRKGAIDAIEAVFPVDPMKSEYAQGIACGVALSKTYIEQLPSAQPEPSQVARDIVTIIENEQDMRVILKNGQDTRAVLKNAQPEIIRCKDCNWFGKAGCAVEIVDDSDKPTEDDFCSFAERRTDEQTVSE